MTEQVNRGAGERLKVRSGINQQRFKVFTMMIMRDDAAGDAPESLDTIGIRVISRRVDQRQLIGEFAQHAAHEQGPLSGVGLEIVRNDDGYTPRAVERATATRTCSQKTSAVRPVAILPSNHPSRQSTSPKP
jgi:hypothetical protein